MLWSLLAMRIEADLICQSGSNDTERYICLNNIIVAACHGMISEWRAAHPGYCDDLGLA